MCELEGCFRCLVGAVPNIHRLEKSDFLHYEQE